MTLCVDIRHDYGGFRLDAQFEAPPGITVLFGRSGSGKSTIIRAVAGLFRPDQARISVDGIALTDDRTFLPPHRRRLGYVFQDGRLFPHLNVRQNLNYGRRLAHPRPAEREFDRIIGILGLAPLLERRPATLSGGEKQRVAIGRALLAAPRLILADEPLAALDAPRKAEILPLFERLRDELGVPILYVSHSASEVARLATTVVALEQGRVIRQGAALDVLSDPMVTPVGPRAAGAVLEAKVVRHHEDGLSELDAGGVALFLPRVTQAPGQALRVRIAASEVILARQRPEQLSALNILPGTIDRIRSGEGPGAIVSLKTAAGTILARVTDRSVAALGLKPGSPCHAIVKTVSIAPENVGG